MNRPPQISSPARLLRELLNECSKAKPPRTWKPSIGKSARYWDEGREQRRKFFEQQSATQESV